MADVMVQALVTDEDPTMTTIITDTEVVVTPVFAAVGVAGPVGPPGPAGPPGPQGPQGQWDQMTQAEYDALVVKDPNVLYVIVG
jgi:hypothetical protein